MRCGLHSCVEGLICLQKAVLERVHSNGADWRRPSSSICSVPGAALVHRVFPHPSAFGRATDMHSSMAHVRVADLSMQVHSTLQMTHATMQIRHEDDGQQSTSPGSRCSQRRPSQEAARAQLQCCTAHSTISVGLAARWMPLNR